MAQYLERLNELTVPEAAAVANQAGAPPQRAPALADAHAPAAAAPMPRRAAGPRAPPRAAAATVSAMHAAAAARVHLPKAAAAVHAAAAGRVQKVLGNVKTQEAGTQQLVAEPRASFFQDAVNNLAAAKKPAHSHLQARTMMLAAAAPPTDNAEEQAADTQMAIEDAEPCVVASGPGYRSWCPMDDVTKPRTKIRGDLPPARFLSSCFPATRAKLLYEYWLFLLVIRKGI